MIKAIFFDLDGTLLSHTTRCIPQDTVQALRKLRDKGIRIFMATGRHSLTRQEETGFEKYIPDGCRFARWCDNGVDIISDQGGKAEGIKYFCNLYGIPQNEIMAFGDAENDIDMLKTAEIGVAMENGGDCVRKIADYVTSGVDDDGIGKALRYFHII